MLFFYDFRGLWTRRGSHSLRVMETSLCDGYGLDHKSLSGIRSGMDPFEVRISFELQSESMWLFQTPTLNGCKRFSFADFAGQIVREA
jgi:hypothetical protein